MFQFAVERAFLALTDAAPSRAPFSRLPPLAYPVKCFLS